MTRARGAKVKVMTIAPTSVAKARVRTVPVIALAGKVTPPRDQRVAYEADFKLIASSDASGQPARVRPEGPDNL